MDFIKAILVLLLILSTGQATMMGHNRHRHHSLLTDKAALLAFKSTIKFYPNCTVTGWGEDVDVCSFRGVSCNKHRLRAVQLILPDCGLSGPLSPFLSNLTGLRVLELYNNYFSGVIPPEFSHLRHLVYLQLDENNLQGPIPESFALPSKLRMVTLSFNNLTEALPPSFFRNCTSLRTVDLSDNFFTGKIPQEIGNSPHLWSLNLYNNQFVGQLPPSLVNTSMYNLDVETNNLSGELPSDVLGKLPSLEYLQLSYNNMISHDNNSNLDPFFTALENCTSLAELQLVSMGLGGRLPSSISQLNIATMLLQENRITGSIPPSIANLTNLMSLNLSSNLLNGNIPAEISWLSKLEQLFLSHNLFSSEIPAAIGQLPRLGLLDLSYNNFSGPIPESLGNLVRLNYLLLNNNLLSGLIPRTLGQCIDLYKLDLSYNRFSGRSEEPGITRCFRKLLIRYDPNKPQQNGMKVPVGQFSTCPFALQNDMDFIHGRESYQLVRASTDQSPQDRRWWHFAIGEFMELGILCTQDSPSARPTMLNVANKLGRLKRYLSGGDTFSSSSSSGISPSTPEDD
ncbi:hypothetical protein Pint_30364 [Pistacia integerrima]|uniref:Uncharacterized protein n=1 Tax=Pistacia integerrima TaxID=434235 RepID=A0ACC0X1N9_9ROSI|nr:hypothetical protein Pint_30364 [Pistacia integerrima]